MAHLTINKLILIHLQRSDIAVRALKAVWKSLNENCTSETIKTAPQCPVAFMSLCKQAAGLLTDCDDMRNMLQNTVILS